MTTARLDIHSPFTLPEGAAAAYARDGCVRLEGVFDGDVLEHYGAEITQRVLDSHLERVPLEDRDTYHRAFLQVTNLWRRSERVKEFVLGRRLGRIAAELMGVEGVRLYHDQALYKEPGGGRTPWHADQYYWPLDSTRCVTAWIPLQATPVEMGALAFALGSHHAEFGRDLPISDESDARLQDLVENAGFECVCEPYALGDVSFHAGWTFHRAGPNRTDTPRRVMTIIFMDRDMHLAYPVNDHQAEDRAAFCPGIVVGEVIASELNPIVWQRDAAD